MSSVPHLVLVQPGAAHVRADGALWIDSKSTTGFTAYAQRFPGQVTLLVDPDPAPPPTEEGVGWVDPATLAVAVDLGGTTPQRLRELRADVALLPMTTGRTELIGAARRSVVVAEHSGRSRYEMALAGGLTGLDRARARLGFARWGRQMATAAARADAVQCNGWVAWEAYGARHRRGLRFYDHRLPGSLIDTAAATRSAAPARSGPLRLGFSGRLIPIKGPRYAVDLATELARRGVQASMTLYGWGPLREELADAAGPTVTLRGLVDFATTWVEEVTHEVDIMVLPYVQSDPAGTYAESLGVGAPILGFDNTAWRGLHGESGAGWVSPARTAAALADVVERLAGERGEIIAASRAASAFMRAHSLEAEFDRRVSQLVELVR